MLKQKLLECKKYWNRDGRILNSSVRTTTQEQVNLHWWSMNRNDKKENVGDMLSPVVCSYMLSLKGIAPDKKVVSIKHLYGIGSIIQGGTQNATIWGSGLKHGESDITPMMRKIRKLDVRLVRGPETRDALISRGYECPEKYGDPAIIMPLIYQPEVEQVNDYLVILHFTSEKQIDGAITPITDNYKDFINQICKSRLVISSSLHGIILAESYGIPAILLKDKVTDEEFKFNDYYFSTGRRNYPIANSVEDALSMPVPDVPDLSNLRKNILETFPYDLWEN